jgi:hypothetical protein
VARTEESSVEVFARASDGNIYRRPYDGSTWGKWAPLAGLGETTDARSDLDCSATGPGDVHIVATGLNPIGALLHAFGTGTTYNRFAREASGKLFDPGPSITITGARSYLGGIAFSYPALFQSGDPSVPSELTPITTQMTDLRSGPDIAAQSAASTGFAHFAAFDLGGALSIHYWVNNASGFYWADPITFSPPTGAFSFSPTICTESGGWGVSSVNVAAVAAGKLWYKRSDSISSSFSSWTQIGNDVASSPDCAIGGPDSIAHIVVLSSTGTVLDVHGKGASWVTTDLGPPR